MKTCIAAVLLLAASSHTCKGTEEGDHLAPERAEAEALLNKTKADTDRDANISSERIKNYKDFLYYADIRFLDEGAMSANNSNTDLTAAAENMTLIAIQNGDPTSVVDCINTQHMKGKSKIDERHNILKSNLAEHKTTFANSVQRGEHELIIFSQAMDELIKQSRTTVANCPNQECIHNEKEHIESLKVSHKKGLSGIEGNVKSGKTTYSDNAISTVLKYIADLRSDVMKVTKKMSKC